MPPLIQHDLNRHAPPARKVTIGAIGVGAYEVDVIEHALNPDIGKTFDFQITNLRLGNLDQHDNIDIYLIGTDDTSNLRTWRQLSQKKTVSSSKPIIHLVERGSPDTNKYRVTTPIDPHATLSVFLHCAAIELPSVARTAITETRVTQSSPEADAGKNYLKPVPSTTVSKKSKLYHRVMVIAEHISIKLLIETQLASRGVHSDLFNRAEDALKMVERNLYDVIFVDANLPDMDGFTLCKEIRHGFFNRITPVILISSNTSTFDHIRGKIAGVTTMIRKPLRDNELDCVTNEIYPLGK